MHGFSNMGGGDQRLTLPDLPSPTIDFSFFYTKEYSNYIDAPSNEQRAESSVPDAATTLNQAKNTLDAFGLMESLNRKELAEHENTSQKEMRLFRPFGDKQDEMTLTVFERMKSRAKLEEITPDLERRLPPELIMEIADTFKEREDLLVTASPKGKLREAPPVINFEINFFDWESVSLYHEGTLVRSLQERSIFQEKANTRQDDCDKQLKMLGEVLAARILFEYREDVREELRYPEPLPLEHRLDVTRLNYRFSITPESNEQQATIRKNERSFQEWNSLQFVELDFKLTQNKNYNRWRNEVNQWYLARMERVVTRLKKQREGGPFAATDLPDPPPPGFYERFPVNKHFEDTPTNKEREYDKVPGGKKADLWMEKMQQSFR